MLNDELSDEEPFDEELSLEDKKPSLDVSGPYCDIQTRNIVLQLMSDKPSDLERRVQNDRRIGFERFLSQKEVEDRHIADEEADKLVADIKAKLKGMGDGFTYTR